MKTHLTVTEINSLFELLIQRYSNNSDQRIVGIERDTIMNNAINRYFRQAFLEEQGQFKNDVTSFGQVIDISSHLVTDKELQVFTPKKGSTVDGFRYLPERFSADSYDIIDTKVYSLLPTEIMYTLEGVALKKEGKDYDGCDEVGIKKTLICNDIELQEYIAVVPFVPAVSTACSATTLQFTITIKDRPVDASTNEDLVLFDYTKFTEELGYNPIKGMKEKGDFVYIANFILEYMNRHNALVEIVSDSTSESLDTRDFEGNFYKVYWERYREQYYPNSFIIVSNERVDVSANTDLAIAGGGTVNPFLDDDYIEDVTYNEGATKGGLVVRITSNFGVDIQSGNTGFTQDVFKQVSRCRSTFPFADYTDSLNPANEKPTPSPVPAPKFTLELVPLTIARDNKSFAKRKMNPLTNRGRQIHARLVESVLELYPVGGQIIDKVYISYYRKPRYLNTRFNVSPDLPIHVMEVIIEYAARHFLELIGSPRAVSATQRITAEKNIENQY